MTATQALQKQIIDYVKNADTRILKMFRAIIEVEKEESQINNIYTEEFKAELDERYQNYLNGGKSYTRAESKKRIDQLLENIK